MKSSVITLLLLSAAPVLAQETDYCTTAEACRSAAEAAYSGDRGDSTSALAGSQDRFYWLNRVNMASFVMLAEEGIIPPELTRPIAEGIQYAMMQAEEPDGRRPSDVVALEAIIIEKSGPEATYVHSGRSRQDMYATITTMQLRQQLLDVIENLNGMRSVVLDLADEHTETFVPAYTNGVQAQPITYGHYLSAFANSYERDVERLMQAYNRVNMSAMGTAVLANSSWPLNRERLADLLGFDRVIQNSLDAGQISTMDVQYEVASDLANLSFRVGSMLQDTHVQYHQIEPWLLLESGSTYRSSSMPQKRNPGIIQNARQAASDVVASMQEVTLRIHNVTPGMTDYKGTFAVSGIMVETVDMLDQYSNVLLSLRVNAERALQELENEWTTSMNTAETMQRLHGTPFRVGHEFASRIVTVARDEGFKPMDFPYERAADLYRAAAKEYGFDATELPLTEEEFRGSVSPSEMVRTRQSTGSPAPREVTRMVGEAKGQLEDDNAWLDERRDALFEAEARLNQVFTSYLPSSE